MKKLLPSVFFMLSFASSVWATPIQLNSACESTKVNINDPPKECWINVEFENNLPSANVEFMINYDISKYRGAYIWTQQGDYQSEHNYISHNYQDSPNVTLCVYQGDTIMMSAGGLIPHDIEVEIVGIVAPTTQPCPR